MSVSPPKRPKLKLNGWLCLDKPLGMTSTQALGRVRWLLNAAKAGHGGTLDPLASGILPLAFGEATKTVEYVMDATKTYHFTIRFGEQRTTDDAEGDVLATSLYRPETSDIAGVLPRFVGDIQQKPPIFSALKIAGQRAYDLARQGNLAELPARPVTIDALDLVGRPNADEVCLAVTCGKGTYVRSLARDIALALGTVGYVSALRRVRVGRFSLENALTIDQLEGMAERARQACLLPLQSALDSFSVINVSAEDARRIRQGQILSLSSARNVSRGNPVLVVCEGQEIAMATCADGRMKSLKVFAL